MTDVRRLHVERTSDPSVLRWVVQHPRLVAAKPGPRLMPATSSLGRLSHRGDINGVTVRNGDVLVSADPARWASIASSVRFALLADLDDLDAHPAATPHWLLVAVATDAPSLEELQEIVNRSAGGVMSAHGGSITVDSVDATTVWLQPSGACHGCSQSDQTVTVIAPAVQAAFPQITRVAFLPGSEILGTAPSASPLAAGRVRVSSRKRLGADKGSCH